MSDTALSLLMEIRNCLRELVAVSKGKTAAVVSRAINPIATDADLDNPRFGDPEIKTAPRDWTGDFHPGQHFSQSDPALLDLVAERYDYFATKNDRNHEVLENGKPKSTYDRMRASVARGWAKRLRSGYVPKKPLLTDDDLTPEWRDDAPF